MIMSLVERGKGSWVSNEWLVVSGTKTGNSRERQSAHLLSHAFPEAQNNAILEHL